MEEKKISIEEQREQLRNATAAAVEEKDEDGLQEVLYGYSDLIAGALGEIRPYEIPLIWAALNQTAEVLLAKMTLAGVEVAQGFLGILHATYVPEVTEVTEQ